MANIVVLECNMFILVVLVLKGVNLVRTFDTSESRCYVNVNDLSHEIDVKSL